MPKPKRSSKAPGEKERFEVLLEEMRSQFKLVLEKLGTLQEQVEALHGEVRALRERIEGLEARVERLEFRVGRLEQQADSFHHAILENSTETKRLQHDIQVLQHEVAKLTERIEAHERSHAG